VFEEREIDSFIRDGYLVVRSAFPMELAAQCRLSAARKLGIDLASRPEALIAGTGTIAGP
jgi:hypothetical protein